MYIPFEISECKIGGHELMGKEDKITLTDDRASSEVWPAPFASLCSGAAAQPTSHASQARDRPSSPCYLWPGTPEVSLVVNFYPINILKKMQEEYILQAVIYSFI